MSSNNKVNIVLDATMLDTLMACEYKFDCRFNKNKVSEFKPKPLDRGDCLHVGEEAYWNSLKSGLPWETALDRCLLHARVAVSKSDLSTEDGNRVLEVLEENHHYWRQDDLSYVILEVERSFAYILYEDEHVRIVMIGKVDLVLSDNQYPVKLMDHKGYDRDFPIQRLQNQGCNYCRALNVNFIWFNRIGFQTSLKARDKHKRIPISYDPIYIRQWERDVIKWSFRYLDCAREDDWPRNFTSCGKFNRLCEYYEVCDTSGEENRIQKLNTNFKDTEPWDVSKSLAKSSEAIELVEK